MKIGVLHSEFFHRISDVFYTLQRDGLGVDYLYELKDKNLNFYDMLFIPANNMMYSIENLLFDFKGKLVIYALNDTCEIDILPVKVLQRAEGIVVNQINEHSMNLKKSLTGDLFNKMILIPRFTHSYIENVDRVNFDEKDNKIVFVGRGTGGFNFNGSKNYRIEALKRIDRNEFLKEHFDGVLCDDHLIDVLKQNEAYNKTFKYCDPDYRIEPEKWIQKLKDNTLSLSVPGNTKLGFRHILSIACKSTMVGHLNQRHDPYKWLFSEMFTDIGYEVKEDFSDFEDKCEEAIQNREKTKEYALKAFDVYKNFYELQPNNTYQNHIWDLVLDNFARVGISF